MREELTIGGLAKATGIPQTTIRFYERKGLLRPARRSTGNYRLYGRAAAERLTFMGAAQVAGFELPAKSPQSSPWIPAAFPVARPTSL